VSACVDHGRQSSVGYARSGSAYARGKQALMHRRVFLEKNGYVPPVVMHTCDNKRCINPDHLIAGDWDKNNKDRAAKGRSAKAVPARRKVTKEQAEVILNRWLSRTKGKDPINGTMKIAADYNIDPGVIYNIARGKSHVY
jgi:hypothetical protein